jgi:hypothetical protein
MRESTYTAKVREKLLTRVEYVLKLSLPYTAGVPDQWISGKTGDLWVEYKFYATLPKVIDITAGAKPKLSKLQQQWLTARHLEGRNVGVVIACAHGAIFRPGLTWVEPINREDFFEECMSKDELADHLTTYVNDEFESRADEPITLN